MLEDSKRLMKVFASARAKTIPALIIIIALIASTVTAYAVTGNAYNVTILDGKKTLSAETRLIEPTEILEEQGIVLNEQDTVDDSDFHGEDGSVLKVQREMTVSVTDGGEIIEGTVVAYSVKDALEQLGIDLAYKDIVEPAVNEAIEDGGVVSIKRAFPVKIIVGATTYNEMANGETVAELLDTRRLTVGEEDTVAPALDTVLKNGDVITLTKVKYQTVTVTEEIAYNTVRKESASLNAGTTKVQQAGENGEKEVTYKIRSVNGEEESRETLEETVLKEATDEIVLVGTKKVATVLPTIAGRRTISPLTPPDSISFDSNGFPTNYKTYYEGKGFAYTGGGTTASGKPAQTGYVAVNPKVIPLGSKLFIVTLDGSYIYGYAIAADTGGFYDSGIVDVYMNSTSECYAWGVRQVRVYVL